MFQSIKDRAPISLTTNFGRRDQAARNVQWKVSHCLYKISENPDENFRNLQNFDIKMNISIAGSEDSWVVEENRVKIYGGVLEKMMSLSDEILFDLAFRSRFAWLIDGQMAWNWDSKETKSRNHEIEGHSALNKNWAEQLRLVNSSLYVYSFTKISS